LFILPVAALLGCTPTRIASEEEGLKELERELGSLRLVTTPTPDEVVIPPTTISETERVAGFLVPLQGRLEARFGEMREGLKLRGILIRGTPGAEVKACKDGAVVYAYEQFPGSGRIIMIDCGKEVRAVYARQGANLVRQGEAVSQGQVIARLASPGGQQPVLFFALYREGSPIDPLTVLPPF
jgi:lipoprotein NlpD